MYEPKNFSKEKKKVRGVAANLGKATMISFNDPALIKDFAFKDDNYEKYFPKIFQNLMGSGGLFLSKGESWKKQRKLISQSFHFELLKSNISNISAICKEVFNTIKEKKL